MSVVGKLSISQISGLFQTAFGGFETDTAGWDHADLIGDIQRNEDFVGNELKLAQLIDYGGGQSSGSLPDSSISTIYNPVLTAKRIYSTSTIDNESLAAARMAGRNKGAFMKATELSMLTMKGSFGDQIARQFFGDGTGSLGEVSSVVTNSAGDYTVTITSATFVEAHWMLKDLLNFASDTGAFEVSDINLTNRTVRVVRQTGSYVPASGDQIYKQKSKDNELTGLKAIVDATAGSTLYGVDVGYRWQASTTDAASAAISVKLLRELERKVRFQSRMRKGTAVTDIVTSLTQLNSLEDAEEGKTIVYKTPSEKVDNTAGGDISHIKLNGHLVRLHWSPFCPNDRVYMYNRNKVSLQLRPDQASGAKDPGGFIQNGDSIFFPLHVSGTPQDAYAMFYKTYGELYFNPVYVGALTNLAT